MDPNTRIVPAVFGQIVTSLDDLDQAIATIILTQPGSVPTSPEKGCDLLPYIDLPSNEAIPKVGRAVWDALTMWEPRIVLTDVSVYETSYARLSCNIYWQPVESVIDDLRSTTVPLNSSGQSLAGVLQ
ncbi:hypothetical protein AN189_02830 [Loktanella sp. 3ANDIMAR09]|nr:hypothetical protein AN189_02830 [Loktanella sp. 3ANDIMAR09]